MSMVPPPDVTVMFGFAAIGAWSPRRGWGWNTRNRLRSRALSRSGRWANRFAPPDCLGAVGAPTAPRPAPSLTPLTP